MQITIPEHSVVIIETTPEGKPQLKIMSALTGEHMGSVIVSRIEDTRKQEDNV